MTTRWPVPNDWTLVDLDDAHLERWREVGSDVGKWMRLRPYFNESPDEVREERQDTYGRDWVAEMKGEDADSFRGMQRDMVLEDASGRLVAAVNLCGDWCPSDRSELGVSVSVAVHADAQGAGIATALLSEIPNFIRAETGLLHAVAHECSANAASISVTKRAGWKEVGAEECIWNYHGEGVDCDGTNLLFCSH